ncbi:hypothetical protein VQ574_20815 (plasmid) [Stutzerimonas frequens]|uniref:hypothetical protein n=1 Tax=Stutzerimonas frequens TaxID=2968969 RepID=UPI002DB72DA2|nr:hypothetical protein [Stutzerimonas frequens]WRW29382.1 hypothetical protein VQ574_20815 [Stutzerimonas frequens]
MRNSDRTYSGCPIISDADVPAYLMDGHLPGGVEYQEVPPGKVVRKRGFWLRPSHRMHHTANLFLISTDVYAMNEDEFALQRDQIYCYRSPANATVYLGRIVNITEDRRLLAPLLDGLHEPFDIDDTGLVYVGRVIAAI